MQKGFATIEIVFATMIIAVLITLTIPNVSRVLDRAALDYETKRLYSELRYLQAISRAATLSPIGIGTDALKQSNPPYMQLSKSMRSYQLMNGNDKSLRERHYMRNVTKMDYTGNIPSERIFFDGAGKANITSNTIKLYPNFGKPSGIVFTSVGRFRGESIINE